jgi:hypothetical protein
VGATQHRGEYDFELDMYVLQFQYVVSPETSPARLALTIVHEAMHARLARLSIAYSEQLRARVERICIAAEIDLAGKLPGGESLAQAGRIMGAMGLPLRRPLRVTWCHISPPPPTEAAARRRPGSLPPPIVAKQTQNVAFGA